MYERAFAMTFLLTEKHDENFGCSTECWIFHNIYVDNHVKVKDHYHVTGEHRCSAQRYCNIKVKLNNKFLLYSAV